MNKTPRLPEEPRTPGRLLLPSLAFSYFAVVPPGVVLGLLLLDIGRDFGYSVGVMGQLRTTASLITALSALFMGVWSIRFKHRTLLLLGLVFINISALGCFSARSFIVMVLFFALSGLGMAMAEPMLYTIVAEHFPFEQRERAIGWILTGVALSPLIGGPVIGVIASFGGWRMPFLAFVLPIALLSLVLVAKGVPSTSRNPQLAMSKGQYMEGFKEVFSNRSATACLAGSALIMAAWAAITVYGASFFREHFMVSLGFASMTYVVSSICYIVGAQVSRSAVNWLGRKPVTDLTTLFTCIFTIAFMTVPNLWLALVFMFIGCVFFGMRATSSTSLTLEQVREHFHGTIMSLNSAAWSAGIALGAGIGGLALIWWDYAGVGLVLGSMSLAATLIYYFLVVDPANTKSHGKIS